MVIPYNMTTNQHTISRIRDYIASYKEHQALYDNKIDAFFIYAFGPLVFMCNEEFEYFSKELALQNNNAKIMNNCAWFIRKLNQKEYTPSYLQECLKIFTLENGKDFSDSPEYLHATNVFAKKLMCNLGRGVLSNESIMTSYAPIVPYETTNLVSSGLARQYNPYTHNCDRVLKFLESSPDDKEFILKELLLNNIYDILLNWDEMKIYVGLNGDMYPYDAMLRNLSKCGNTPDETSLYFLYSALAYNRVSNGVYAKYIEKNKNLWDPVKMSNIDTVRTAIESYADVLGCAAYEMFNDSSIDLISPLGEQIKRQPVIHGMDLYKLEDYISVHRYMRFDDATNQTFTGQFEQGRIINVSDMGNHKIFYEVLDKYKHRALVCPFVDLRDYQIRILILRPDKTDSIEVLNDISEL